MNTFAIFCLLFSLSFAIPWNKNFTYEINGYVFSNDILFVLQSTDTIVAVDLKTGNNLWNWNITKENKCPSRSACVILTNIKFDSKSGILFVIAADANLNVSPRAASFFGFSSGGVLMWSVPYSTSNTPIKSAVNDGTCYITSTLVIQVEAYDCTTGNFLWKSTDIPALDTACFRGWISLNLEVEPTTQIITYHCGPVIAAWDNKGQSIWTQLTVDRFLYGFKFAPKSILLSKSSAICSVSVVDFTQNWCVQNDGGTVAGTYPNGFIIINETSLFPTVVTLSGYDLQGKYLWSGPSVTYTGVVQILQSPMWGELGNYYWAPGQPGGLYVLRETDGMVLNQPDVTLFDDLDARVVNVDDNGLVYIMGDMYVVVVPTVTT